MVNWTVLVPSSTTMDMVTGPVELKVMLSHWPAQLPARLGMWSGTVMVAVPSTPSMVAVMVALPSPAAVTRPV